MKPLFRRDLWLLGVACTPAIAMAGLLYPSHMLHYVPYGPYGPVLPTVPTQENALENNFVRQVGEHAYEITNLKFLNEQFDSRYGCSTLIVAGVDRYIVQGKFQGLRLSSMRRNSVYVSLGFQNGDIIQRINGFTLDALEKVMGLSDRLNAVHPVEVDLLRDGVPLRKVYSWK